MIRERSKYGMAEAYVWRIMLDLYEDSIKWENAKPGYGGSDIQIIAFDEYLEDKGIVKGKTNKPYYRQNERY